MTTDELGSILRTMYESGPSQHKTTNIHLFGIKYATVIRESGVTPAEILRSAHMQDSYVTEVHKGMRIAEHVEAKF